MDLRQLRNVIAVIENGSIGKAAEALYISQPALTKSIQRLEESLQVPLFYRDARGTHPTIYGECLRAHAQAVNVGVSQALAEIKALKVGSSGVLTIAAPPSVAVEVLPDAILMLTKERPRLQVRVVTFMLDPLPGLLAGEYDFIINVLNGDVPAESGLKQRLLYQDRLTVISRKDHPITRVPVVTPHDLRPYQWAIPRAENLHRRRLERMFEAEGLAPPQPAIECSLSDFFVAAVMRSDYLAITAKLWVQASGNEGRIAMTDIDSPFMLRSIGIIWREHQVLSPASLLMIQAIEAACHQHGLALPTLD
jgi:DNA-binding transcriptional LysR family regulator